MNKSKAKLKTLLHICCAPDATAVFERLKPEYEVIGFFHNPNIFPEAEYKKRLEQVELIVRKLKFELVVPAYTPEEWENAVKGLEAEPEKGKRCDVCFRFNLEATAKKAISMGIPFFTTTLTISPHKKTEMIFKAGRDAALKYSIKFLEFDFKKKDGFKRSLELSREMNLYRQSYCGCRYSM
jgi:predicted adenine nucleotide alpha hydrolase (AANH) superfamily ATPase